MKDKNKVNHLPTQKVADTLIHLYRGEMQRVNTWRNRLDATPHWAILLVTGVISWTFSSPERSSSLILIAIPFVLAFLILEADRYQMHEIWRSRLRLIEENFFARALDQDSSLPQKEWTKILAQDLKVPKHKISFLQAVGIRLRRIYIWVFLAIFLSWIFKVSVHPYNTDQVEVLLKRAQIGVFSGEIIFVSILLFTIILMGLMFFETKKRKKKIKKKKLEIPEEEPGYNWRRENNHEEEKRE